MPLILSLLLALQAPVPPAAPDTAVLMVGIRPVIVFRSTLGASSPAERAALAQERIARAAQTGVASVVLRPGPAGTVVLVGDRAAFIVTPADVDTIRGETVDSTARAAAAHLTLALTELRETRSLRTLSVGVALSLLGTLILAGFLRLLRRTGGWALRRLSRYEGVHFPPGFRWLPDVLQPQQIVRGLRALLIALGWVVGIAACYVYLTFILTRFPWSRPWGEALGHYLVTLLARLGLGILRAIPDIATVLLILLITRFMLQLVRRLFQGVEAGRISIPGLHRDTANPTRRLVTALIWLFAVIVVYPYLPGSGTEAFKGVSVFAGLLISLGSAGLVGQAMSGLVLMYSRGYQPGDFVKVGAIEGTVETLGLLSTRIRTPKDEYVTLPNAVVVSGTVTNFSAAARAGHDIKVYTSVTIGYDVPRRQVEELLLAAAASAGVFERDPGPFVLIRALNDWYVEYQINATLAATRAWELPQAYSRLHGAIYDAFAEAGVEIMSPSYFALRDGNTPTVPRGQP